MDFLAVNRVDYQNAPLVTAFLGYLGVPAHLREDAFSIGLMALLEAERKQLRPRIVIKRRLIDFLRIESPPNRLAGMTQRVHQNRCEVREDVRDALRLLYEEQGLSDYQIAERTGISRSTICRMMSTHGIARRPAGRPRKSKGEAA